MEKTWGPSAMGRRFTGSAEWMLALDHKRVVLIVNGKRHQAAITDSSPVRLQHGLFWTRLTLFHGTTSAIEVAGVPKREAKELAQTLEIVARRNASP